MLVGVAYAGAYRTLYTEFLADRGRDGLVLICEAEDLDYSQRFTLLQAQVLIINNGISIYR